jgi:predicted transcriptional regulator
MLRPVRVRDRMRPGAVAVAWGDSAEAALARMREAGLEALPVVNDGRVIGLLEREAVLLCERGGDRLDAVPVTDLMRRGVFVCRADDALAHALATMDRLEVDRLAVLDDAGRVVGTLGRDADGDALRRLVPAFYGAY